MTLVTFIVVFVLVSLWFVYDQLTAIRLSRQSWAELVAQIEPASTAILAIAMQYRNPSLRAAAMEPGRQWRAIGRAKGVRLMLRNAHLLIALAAQAERVRTETTRNLIAAMRSDGLSLRRSAFMLAIGICTGYDPLGSILIQKAASAYYCLVFRLSEAVRELDYARVTSLTRTLWAPQN